LILITAGVLWAQENPADDKSAVQLFMEQLQETVRNKDSAGFARLFTDDGDLWDAVGRRATGRNAVERSVFATQAWSETAGPFLRVEDVRVLAPTVALADATLTWYGSMIVASKARAVFVLQKQGPVWRIASCRIMASCWPGTAWQVAEEK
jgi:uncharacterized protein (TIGR02246 family)